MSESYAARLASAWMDSRPAPTTRHTAVRLKRVLRRLVKRRMEGLLLYLPFPSVEEFHACDSKWRVLDGSNRAGKTQGCAAEACRAWCGCDPYDKYLPTDGNSLVVGLDADHLAMQWRKCYEPGAFKIIPDEHTNLWRAVRPNPCDPLTLDPYDEAHREKWRDAPPLIPRRLLVGEPAWEDRAKGVPRFATFTTGWRALFRSSNGKAPQGDHYQFGWFDEHIENEQFYDELVRGLVGLAEPPQWMPRAIWGATPQNVNQQLQDLRDRADAGSTTAAAFQVLIKDNPYIPADEKQAFWDSLTEEEREVRWFGRYRAAGRRVYAGHFHPMQEHGYEPFDIPDDWSRWILLDPGRQYCGTLFLAVDPDEQHRWIYGGFVIKGGAQQWAARVREAQEDVQFEGVVCDYRMGRQKPVGDSTHTVAEQYSRALRDAGVHWRTQGTKYGMGGFVPGSDDIPAREEALLRWMAIRPDGPFAGTPVLRVARGQIPKLEEQIKHALTDVKDGQERRKKQQEDLLQPLEYGAAYNPFYREPVPVKDHKPNPIWESYQRKKTAARRRQNVSGRELG